MEATKIPRNQLTTLAIDKETARALSVKALQEGRLVQWITQSLALGYINEDPFIVAYLQKRAGGAA